MYHVTPSHDIRFRFITSFYYSSPWVFHLHNVSVTGVVRGEEVWAEHFNDQIGKGYSHGQLDMDGVERWSLQLPKQSSFDALSYFTVFYTSSDHKYAALFAGDLDDVAYWVSEEIDISANDGRGAVQVAARFANDRLTAVDEDWMSLSIR